MERHAQYLNYENKQNKFLSKKTTGFLKIR